MNHPMQSHRPHWCLDKDVPIKDHITKGKKHKQPLTTKEDKMNSTDISIENHSWAATLLNRKKINEQGINTIKSDIQPSKPKGKEVHTILFYSIP